MSTPTASADGKGNKSDAIGDGSLDPSSSSSNTGTDSLTGQSTSSPPNDSSSSPSSSGGSNLSNNSNSPGLFGSTSPLENPTKSSTGTSPEDASSSSGTKADANSGSDNKNSTASDKKPGPDAGSPTTGTGTESGNTTGGTTANGSTGAGGKTGEGGSGRESGSGSGTGTGTGSNSEGSKNATNGQSNGGTATTPIPLPTPTNASNATTFTPTNTSVTNVTSTTPLLTNTSSPLNATTNNVTAPVNSSTPTATALPNATSTVTTTDPATAPHPAGTPGTISDATHASSSHDDGPNVGAIIGGIAGGLVGVILLVYLILIPVRKRAKQNKDFDWLDFGKENDHQVNDGTDQSIFRTPRAGVGEEEDKHDYRTVATTVGSAGGHSEAYAMQEASNAYFYGEDGSQWQNYGANVVGESPYGMAYPAPGYYPPQGEVMYAQAGPYPAMPPPAHQQGWLSGPTSAQSHSQTNLMGGMSPPMGPAHVQSQGSLQRSPSAPENAGAALQRDGSAQSLPPLPGKSDGGHGNGGASGVARGPSGATQSSDHLSRPQRRLSGRGTGSGGNITDTEDFVLPYNREEAHYASGSGSESPRMPNKGAPLHLANPDT